MIATEFFTQEEIDLFIEMYKVYQLPKYQNGFEHGCKPEASYTEPYGVVMIHTMDHEGMYRLVLKPDDIIIVNSQILVSIKSILFMTPT